MTMGITVTIAIMVTTITITIAVIVITTMRVVIITVGALTDIVWSHGEHRQHPYMDRRAGLVRGGRRDGRKAHKLFKRKHRRHHHRNGHMIRDRLCRAYLRYCEDADQPLPGVIEVPGVEGRNSFPSHLLRDGLDAGERENRTRNSQFADLVLGGLIEATMTPSQQVALAVVESLAAMQGNRALQQHPRLVSRPGHRETHCSHRHLRHHDNCYPRRPTPSQVSVHQRPAEESVDVVPEVPAPVPVTQIVNEAGPSATYEEKLAEGLIPFPVEAAENSALSVMKIHCDEGT
ncbi:hypothetical protein R1flu_027129 [Riccia fluitans]|uniref:Uncharacterized protein n=1 Tax=Riccia fluitans TaxID=41844 RepID=A0ABD1XHZ6_9MARC